MNKFETVTLGSGCFWCIEAIFEAIRGVVSVESGYSGGALPNPTYNEISTGESGHAEVVQIKFDKEKISLEDILEVFWNSHDPTTLNRQGNDIGTQYRSVIFYHNEKQKNTALEYLSQIEQSGLFSSKIVTEITKFDSFFIAENYHQDFYSQNGEQPYCTFVIKPKVEKLKKQFKDILK